MRMSCAIGLAGLAVVVGCKGEDAASRDPTPPEPSPSPPRPTSPSPPATATGACNNLEGAAARCTVGPVIRATDTAPQPDTVLYDVTILADAGAAGTFPLVLHLRVPTANADELEQYYRASSDPVACTATIIRPPCNPAGSHAAIPSLPVPSYARAEYY